MGRLLWIASYPKSGNTWVRLFLYAYAELGRGPVERLDLDAPAFDAFSVQDNHRSWYEPALERPWEEATRRDAAAARPKVHAAMAEAGPGFVPVKTHNLMAATDGVPTITAAVTAGAIYIVRNPLDVAISVKDHFGAKSIGKAIQQMNFDDYRQKRDARFVDAPVGSWRRNVESWAGARRSGVHVVRYEDMLAKPDEVFASILGKIGAPPDPARLKDAIRLTRFDALAAAEREDGFRERSGHAGAFFARGSAGHWRETLTTGQVRAIVGHNHAMMRRFGYLDGPLERFAPKASARR